MNDISISFTWDFIQKKIWVDIDDKEIRRIMVALWFDLSWDFSSYIAKVPSYRATKDISIKEDIAEEIWRVYSYDKVSEVPLKWVLSIVKWNKQIELKKIIRDHFASNSMFEVYNYSFSNEFQDEKLWIADHNNAIRIINAYSSDFTLYRRFMAANLLSNVKDNKNIAAEFSFFEIWKIWSKKWSDITETLKLAWVSYSASFEIFKSRIDSFINMISSGAIVEYKQWMELWEIPYMHPNKSWKIYISGLEIWYFWYINPQVASSFELDDNKLMYFEFDFDKLFEIWTNADKIFSELPKFPWIDRELNFVMDDKTVIWDVISKINSLDELIRWVSVLDIYRNEEKIWKEKKSVVFSVKLLDYEKTITDQDAMRIQNAIISELKKNSIEIRS